MIVLKGVGLKVALSKKMLTLGAVCYLWRVERWSERMSLLRGAEEAGCWTDWGSSMIHYRSFPSSIPCEARTGTPRGMLDDLSRLTYQLTIIFCLPINHLINYSRNKLANQETMLYLGLGIIQNDVVSITLGSYSYLNFNSFENSWRKSQSLGQSLHSSSGSFIKFTVFPGLLNLPARAARWRNV